MKNKKLKKGFIGVLSVCLVLSNSFNAFALSPLQWKHSIKIIDENGEELSTGANIERGTTLYADLYFSVDPQSYEVQWYVDSELAGTGEEFVVPEGDGTGTLYANIEGEGPLELTSTNKHFSDGTGQFYIMPGTGGNIEGGDSGNMGEEVTYSLELQGVAKAGETLTGLFSPIEKVGGMGDISYIWYINGNAITSESGYKKESTTYTVNNWDTGEVYVEAYYADINSESQQIQSNILTIEEVDYILEIVGTPQVGETIEAIINPELDAWVNWYVNGEYTDNPNALNNEQSRFYTIKDGDEEIYAMIYTTKDVISNTLTVEKTEAGTGDNTEGEGSEGGSSEAGEGNGDSGADNTGDTGNTDTGAGNTDNTESGENAGNEGTDNKDEAGDTGNKGDNETGGEGGTGDTGTGEEGSEGGAGDTGTGDNTESGENTDDKGNTDSGTGEDGSLDDDVNISTPSDAEKEDNKGDNDIIDNEKNEEDKTDNNNKTDNDNINTDNNNSNSSNSSNSNNSNSHSSSSHSSSNSTNSETSEVYKWEFVNYKNQNYKWFWRSNKGNVHKGWLLCPLDNYWYYFDLEEGYMLEGQQTIEGKTYYFQQQEETPNQTYYLENGEWVYKAPSSGTRPWGSMQ